MKKQFLDAGKIINTHGVRGELKVEPWADSPAFLKEFKTFYIDGEPHKVASCRVSNNFVILSLEDCTDMDSAIKLKNRILKIDRNDAHLSEGEYFLDDLIGLDAVNIEDGEKFGVMSDIMYLPAGNVYVIKGAREILIPANEQFVKKVDIEGGYIHFALIEGM